MKEIYSVARTIRHWWGYIQNSWKYGRSNVFSKGLNNKIKTLKRVVFGLHSFERFRKQIFLTRGKLRLSKLLRGSFQTALLNELHSRIGDSFKKLKASVYADHKNGGYVQAMPNKCNPSQVIKYIGRYLGRPVIATSRIDSYDGEFVAFHYNRHEDEKLVIETIPVLASGDFKHSESD